MARPSAAGRDAEPIDCRANEIDGVGRRAVNRAERCRVPRGRRQRPPRLSVQFAGVAAQRRTKSRAVRDPASHWGGGRGSRHRDSASGASSASIHADSLVACAARCCSDAFRVLSTSGSSGLLSRRCRQRRQRASRTCASPRRAGSPQEACRLARAGTSFDVEPDVARLEQAAESARGITEFDPIAPSEKARAGRVIVTGNAGLERDRPVVPRRLLPGHARFVG